MAINPDATIIPDQAEVWFKLASGVTDITTMMPLTPTGDLTALGWEEVGLIDDAKGIPLTPSGEVKEFNAFGHPSFRVKFRLGKLKSGFTALEYNTVTKKFVMPGSAANKRGIPRDIQGYLAYRFVDGANTNTWVTLRPALIEHSDHGPIVDGDLSWATLTVHHTADANRDVFQTVDDTTDDVTKTFTIAPAVTTYTVTVGASTTTPITTKTAADLQAALRLLPSVIALPNPDVTVTGPTGGPLVALFTSAPGVVSATGTGGTVTVA
jgi:hypothetical protein